MGCEVVDRDLGMGWELQPGRLQLWDTERGWWEAGLCSGVARSPRKPSPMGCTQRFVCLPASSSLSRPGKQDPHQACPSDSLWPHPRCSGKRAAHTARRVIGLELDTEGHRLFVAFSGCIIYLPLSRCARHGACRR